jgi:cytochrome c-type biogenesis protein CcmF
MLRIALGVAIVAGIAYPILLTPEFVWSAAFGMVLAFWVTASTVVAIKDRLGPHGNWRHIPRGFWGMVMGHIGIAVFIVGVTLTSIYSIEEDVRLAPGERYQLGEHSFEFLGVEKVDGPNYTAYRGTLIARHGDRIVGEMYPENRTYLVQTMPMTEAAIDAGLTRDLFVALGDDLGGGAWSIRLYHKPFVRWLWLGALIMSIGAGVAASDRRYRRLAKREREMSPDSASAHA